MMKNRNKREDGREKKRGKSKNIIVINGKNKIVS